MLSLSQIIYFLLLGLATGGIYSLLSTGLILKYRSSGVVDFGHAAVAMFIAYVYIELHTYGQLVFPWVVIPHTITLSGHPFGTALSIVIALAYSAIFGALLYVAVFRPLRHASQLIRVSASVGVMVYLQAIAILNFGSISVATNAILPGGTVKIFGIAAVPAAYFWLAGIAIVLSAVVAAAYRFTRFGLATRAAAENEQGAAVTGLSADRIAGGNWIIASVLAGFAGILIAPIDQVAPTFATLYLVPLFGIALVARFRSFGIATIAALLLAMAQSELYVLNILFPTLPSGWSQALPQVLPFVVVIVAMMLLSRGIGARGEETTQRNPSLGYPARPYLTAAGVFVAGVIAMALFHDLLYEQLVFSTGMVCIALSVVVLTGYVGQISLAQMSLAAVSALLLTHLTVSVGIGFPFTLLIASLAAVPLGLLIGLPALRLRGVNLAVVTLAAASVVDVIFTDWQSFAGGLAGLKVPSPTLIGWNIGIADGPHYPRLIFGIVAIAIVCLVGVMVARLRRSATGRMMIAVRSNERAAAAAGIDVARTKLFAFGLSAWIAGIGGCLIAYQGRIVSPVTFSSQSSLALLAVVMVAGLGRIAGAVVAGVMLTANGLLVTYLNVQLGIGNYQLVVAGLALTVTAIANPNGIAANPPPPLVWAARRFGQLIPGGWGPPPRPRLASSAAGAAGGSGEAPVPKR
jgi:ABC-type branched-subunit amino acid transport system permease subunit